MKAILLLQLWWLGLASVAGCGATSINAMRYGQSAGVAGHNIQGTSLLASMFRDAGYRLTTARTLGRTVNRANVVVWFPDRFSPPSNSSCDFFENWLGETPGRTLVYVGRDYHADVAYWRRMNDQAAAAGNAEPRALYDLQRIYARARANEQARASRRSESESCRWFRVDRDILPRDADNLRGAWAEQAAEAKYPAVVSTHWTLQGIHADHAETLLASGDELLVTKISRPHWRNNKLLLVTNGSIFLNLPLIEPANQVLARRLIGQCGAPGRAVFLTSGVVDPPIASAPRSHYLLRAFTTPPLRCILMHLSVVGMIYCFAVYPIFGRPRNVRQASRTDFGRHVLALGRLLAAAADAEHACAARKEYMQKVHGTLLAESSTSAAAAAGNPFRAQTTADQDEADRSRATE
jgi:hypothetical protein